MISQLCLLGSNASTKIVQIVLLHCTKWQPEIQIETSFKCHLKSNGLISHSIELIQSGARALLDHMFKYNTLNKIKSQNAFCFEKGVQSESKIATTMNRMENRNQTDLSDKLFQNGLDCERNRLDLIGFERECRICHFHDVLIYRHVLPKIYVFTIVRQLCT